MITLTKQRKNSKDLNGTVSNKTRGQLVMKTPAGFRFEPKKSCCFFSMSRGKMTVPVAQKEKYLSKL